MEKEQIDSFKQRITKISDQLSDICSELHYEALPFFENGIMFEKLTDMALDADNMSERLRNTELSKTSVQLNYRDTKAIFDVNDDICYINNGFVGRGIIDSIQCGKNEYDGYIMVKIADGICISVPNADIIPFCIWFKLERELGWNRLVNKLKTNGKTLKLTQQKHEFYVTLSNGDNQLVYSSDAMTINNFTQEFIQTLEKL